MDTEWERCIEVLEEELLRIESGAEDDKLEIHGRRHLPEAFSSLCADIVFPPYPILKLPPDISDRLDASGEMANLTGSNPAPSIARDRHGSASSGHVPLPSPEGRHIDRSERSATTKGVDERKRPTPVVSHRQAEPQRGTKRRRTESTPVGGEDDDYVEENDGEEEKKDEGEQAAEMGRKMRRAAANTRKEEAGLQKSKPFTFKKNKEQKTAVRDVRVSRASNVNRASKDRSQGGGEIENSLSTQQEIGRPSLRGKPQQSTSPRNRDVVSRRTSR